MARNKNATEMMIRAPATYRNRLRERIRAGKMIGQLQKCVMGEIEMSPQQVAAARILLNKVLPDASPPKTTDQNGHEIKDVRHIPTWKLLEAVDGEFREVGRVEQCEAEE